MVKKVSRLHRPDLSFRAKSRQKLSHTRPFVVRLCPLPQRAESEHASSGGISMKNKRIKSYRRAMQLYQSSFGFRSVSTSPHQRLCALVLLGYVALRWVCCCLRNGTDRPITYSEPYQLLGESKAPTRVPCSLL